MQTALLFVRDERGATAIEYCLIGATVSIAILAGVTSIGQSLKNWFGQIAAVN